VPGNKFSLIQKKKKLENEKSYRYIFLARGRYWACANDCGDRIEKK
jgi:hypothetical protein